MKISEAFPSKYLKAADLNEKHWPMVITSVESEKVGRDEEHKPVVYFTKTKKGLVLNKTNSKAIAATYGDDTDEWTGKTIILFSMMVQFGDEMVESIRVRTPKAAPGPAVHAAVVAAVQQHTEVNPPPVTSHPGGGDMDDEIPFASEWR